MLLREIFCTCMMAIAMVLIRAWHGDRVAERRGPWSWYDGDDDGDDDGDYDYDP